MPSINFAVYPRGKPKANPSYPGELDGNLLIECQATGFQPVGAIDQAIAEFKERLRTILRDNPRITTFD